MKQQFIQSSLLSKYSHIKHGFSTRSLSTNNRCILSKYSPKQIHSARVYMLNNKKSKIGQYDAIITRLLHTPIAVQTADCVPLLLFAPHAGYIAIVHSGWKGTLHHIIRKTVFELEQRGCLPAKLFVAIGPSIGPCCYSIPIERAQLFKDEFGEKRSHTTKRSNRTYINLSAILIEELLTMGILRDHIDIISMCTYCTDDLFYSYRRGDRGKNMISYIEIL